MADSDPIQRAVAELSRRLADLTSSGGALGERAAPLIREVIDQFQLVPRAQLTPYVELIESLERRVAELEARIDALESPGDA